MSGAPRVLVADPLPAEALEAFRARGLEVVDRAGQGREAVLEALPGCAALVVRSGTRVDRPLLEAAAGLRVVGRAGTGVDNIDLEAATARGVLVLNTPGENTLSAAEHTLALLLALARRIPEAAASMREGRWERKAFLGTELLGKTAGVVGLGRIGREVALRLRAFGMTVLAYDPYLAPEAAAELGVEATGLEDLLRRSRVVTLHVPRTEQTENLLDAHRLALLPEGALVVNAARGGLVDEAALLEALERGRLGGAALDVFREEPLAADSPLRSHPRVLLTPHLGASTAEAQRKVGLRIAEQIAAFLLEGEVRSAVNLWSLDAPAARRLAPYAVLGRALGRLAVQLLEEPRHLARLEVELAGSLLELPREALLASVLEGVLGSILDLPVNAVNARSLAAERGLPVALVEGTDTDGYAGLLTVRVRPEEGRELLLAGTVFGERYPKAVRIDDFHVETRLKGAMLLVRNDDRPGRLAAITRVIAEHGVNIADMALGRERRSGQALAVLHLDSPLPEGGLREMRAVPGVSRVQVLRFPAQAEAAPAPAAAGRG